MTTHYAPTHCEHAWNEATSNGDKQRLYVCSRCGGTKSHAFEDDKTDDFKYLENHLSPNTVVVG